MLKSSLKMWLTFVVILCMFLIILLTSKDSVAASNTMAGFVKEDPGLSYGPASRDWLDSEGYYYIENEEIKLTIGTQTLSTQDPDDWGNEATGNNKWGTLTPGHIMDAAPKFNMYDNLDYTEFVLSKDVDKTWWYPTEKLNMPNVKIQNNNIVANGSWDGNENIKAQVTYSIVENTPLIKMKVKLTNEGTSAYSGNLAYIIDPEEKLEQQSYVPGWGWRGGQVNEYITSGWNKNYIFNGIQDKYTGNTAHAIIWPDNQQPSAVIPEGYITGTWFNVSLGVNETQELIIYQLPHNPGPAYAAYNVAEFWANIVKKNIDPQSIGKITGTVTDDDGNPSSGVDIKLNTQSGEQYAVVTTDDRGRYNLYAMKGDVYNLNATNETSDYEREISELVTGSIAQVDFQMEGSVKEVIAGVTNGDPGYNYEGTSRDWWPKNDYYYIENPYIKFSVGTVRTAGMDPVDWSNNASGNNKWGTLTPGHIMDSVSKLNMQENIDFTEFVLSDDLGSTPEDEASGKYMDWSWFHPLTKLQLPGISLDERNIVARGNWDNNEKMKATVRYSIVEGTPLIKMEIKLDNQTGENFNGDFGYIVDVDQPGGQQSYLPGKNWVYGQQSKVVNSGWTDNYLFSGINNTYTGNTAHGIIWPEEQQPKMIINEGIWIGTWFEASIPSGQSEDYVIYQMPHIPGPAEEPQTVAEFWAEFISNHEDPENYGSITGTVTNEIGEPVPFTKVECIGKTGHMYTGVTNKKGKYQIFTKKGTYEITPVNEEYSVDSKTVEIADERRVETNFIMKNFAEVEIEMPNNIKIDTPFDIKISVKNLTDNTLENVNVDILPPYFVRLMDKRKIIIPSIEAGSKTGLILKGIALEGGRSLIKANVNTKLFNVKGKSNFNVTGAGYYSGDSHSHTSHSDGVNTVAENASSAYKDRLLSWVWNTDHNTFVQKEDADEVTLNYDGKFLSLAGTEITTPVGHALALGLNEVPKHDIEGPESGYTWQDSIDDVIRREGLFYIAHPFDQTYTFQKPKKWRGFTGVEVWNGSKHALDNGLNEAAFRFWDEINIRGDGKYYGVANSDAHTKEKVGDPFIRGWMPDLSEEKVLEMLKTGRYYGSNGPKIRFSIDGVEMGSTLKIKKSKVAQFNIQAYDPNSNITHVRLIKLPITGDTSDYTKKEVVYEKDLTSLRINEFIETINLPVEDNEFYRLEVQSEKAQEYSTGSGPIAGTGFAFSNPVWVKLSDDSNAAAIKSISYKNKNKYKESISFGVNSIKIYDNKFKPKKINVTVSKGAKVTSIRYSKIKDARGIGILKLVITANDGSRKNYKYLVNISKEREGE
ncbi:CehA/McbA family metallohydrolase [Virgibacillus dakarensis]|uniref:CehA/McbA family metallohydrolase n=1 Tax=Virgibacillus dakarensis TaxID=1917889 RepID=UPI000B44A2BA|nr:CehA/McbA family metallohydrolase [Virgibacillus dakarensis]